MRVLIGIDDTDNLESRGTGYRARQLGKLLGLSNLAQVKRISRHQLFVSPEIPFTSHNSSVCLDADIDERSLSAIRATCRSFLLEESAPGSDAGLCVAVVEQVTKEIEEFGAAAKVEVLEMSAAERLAAEAGLHLEGLTGERIGVIGALAGVGLAAAGNDGRCLWMPGLRELPDACEASEVMRITGIEAIKTLDGISVPTHEHIEIGAWPRPVLMEGQAVLLVEGCLKDDAVGWRVIPKEIIKQVSG